jgi:FAD/FMN-containing dehydrogenase
MKTNRTSRRLVLKQVASLAALGALATFRAGTALASAGVNRLYGTKIPGVTGKVISRQDSNYELWRRAMVWHHSKPKRYPELIVQVQSVVDVIAAVKYAADNKLRVSVRAGGHNSTGTSVRQGGMVIDVSALSEIRIDLSKQLASIQPGVRSLDLTIAAGKEGLSFPVPHCPSVGLSGFSMGGGIGWNYPQHGGVAVHSIVGAEIIAADGEVLTVNAKENPDLFWAVRGAGPGFFGVVTRLHLQLYPLPKSIMASSYITPLDHLEMVTSSLEKIRKENDVSRVELIAVLMQHPETPPEAPPKESKICFFTAFAFEDSVDEARAALEPFTRSELATKSMVKFEHQEFTLIEMYDKYFSLRDPAGRQGRYKVDNILTNDGSGALLALADHFRNAPTKDCHILAAYNLNIGQKADSCFSWVADCFVGCYAIWDREENDAVNYEWLSKTLPLMDSFAVGHYPNEVEPRHTDRYRKCYSDENWQRLEHLRAKYDPNGVFHTYLTQEEAKGVST